jgi:NAD(P)H dehydrogenase (quinone)
MVPDPVTTLVVHAHPDPTSFNHAVVAAAVEGLRRSGTEPVVIDLYAEGFDPRMSAAERLAYESGEPILHEQVGRYAELVTGAHTLVVVYPTWWFGLPAILKGFLDRVLVPGVGFRIDERSGRIRPGLTNVRRIVGISTYGSPRTYVRLVGDPGRRTILRTLRLICHRRCRTRWLGLYAVDSATEARRSEFLTRVTEELAR